MLWIILVKDLPGGSIKTKFFNFGIFTPVSITDVCPIKIQFFDSSEFRYKRIFSLTVDFV
jgi:hypothetical protein